MDIILEPEKTKDSIWEDYVPIIESGKTYKVFLTDIIEAPSAYNQLVYLLQTAEHYHTIELYLNNGGGVIDSAFYIRDAILNTDAHVVAYLSGTVASAATIIALSCDAVVCSKYLSFMIHNYSTGASGKGHEIKAYQNFTDRELNKAFREIYNGFLTDDEMTKIIDGADMWLSTSEVEHRLSDRSESNVQGS
jgi:ATP-dependent protease ClpP protease subunit